VEQRGNEGGSPAVPRKGSKKQVKKIEAALDLINTYELNGGEGKERVP